MRLIDVDAPSLRGKLKMIREGEYQIYGKEAWGFAAKCETAIEDAPTVDAVPVVRCYKCFQSEPCLKKNSVYCNKLHDVVMRDWFCADGERREE